MAVWYCEQVVALKVPACMQEIQACRRFLDMRAAAKSGAAAYYWSDADVIDVCSFIEKLHHTKGRDDTMTLEPVQCWWLAGIFAFREVGTGLRWVRSVSFWVPRKNGKSTLSVGVVLYCLLCEGEVGAEATISAGSEGQAHIPYDMITATLRKDPELKDHWQAHITKDFTEFRRTGAKITLATAKASNLDGLNPHVVLAEELHAQSQEVIGVLRTAMAARRCPLWLSISTAGRDVTAAAFDDLKSAEAVLDGRLKADRLFAVIYQGTKEDGEKRFDDRVLEKLNPLWGVSLKKAGIEEEQIEARKSPSKLNEYLRTRLNIWSRAAGNLINVESWRKCADPQLNLDIFRGLPLFVGIDLASRNDLNAAAFLTQDGGTVYTSGQYWLPQEAERFRDDRYADSFMQWAQDGAITLTPGNYIDYRVILKAILDTLEGHRVVGVGLDDYQANLMAKEIEDRGHPVFIVPKRAKYLTASTEDLIARVEDPALFQQDDNPVTEWCAGNVVGHFDANSNVLPKKEKPNSKANIDGVDALILANALRIDWEAGVLGLKDADKAVPNPYYSRGLAGARAA